MGGRGNDPLERVRPNGEVIFNICYKFRLNTVPFSTVFVLFFAPVFRWEKEGWLWISKSLIRFWQRNLAWGKSAQKLFRKLFLKIKRTSGVKGRPRLDWKRFSFSGMSCYRWWNMGLWTSFGNQVPELVAEHSNLSKTEKKQECASQRSNVCWYRTLWFVNSNNVDHRWFTIYLLIFNNIFYHNLFSAS